MSGLCTSRISFLLMFLGALSATAAPAPTLPLPRMVLVEGGTFLQGSDEAPYAANERVHKATLSSYLIAETETTQKLWSAVMGANPSKFRGEDRPVDFVSWFDAVRFCNELSVREGLEVAYAIEGKVVTWNRAANGYRLPTEAEWEYAARGGRLGVDPDVPLKQSPYAGGSEAEGVAWFDRNSSKATQPVARKAPNELGLFDMSGNVWEWCWDWYGDYPRTDVVDYAGIAQGATQRVLRGGAWFTPMNLLRVTYRYWNAPTFKVNSVGFRLARNATSDGERFPLDLPAEVGVDAFQILSAPDSGLPH